MNLAGLVDFSGKFEDTFGGSCLSRIHVREDTNVPVDTEVSGHVLVRFRRAVSLKMGDLSRLEVFFFSKEAVIRKILGRHWRVILPLEAKERMVSLPRKVKVELNRKGDLGL